MAFLQVSSALPSGRPAFRSPSYQVSQKGRSSTWKDQVERSW